MSSLSKLQSLRASLIFPTNEQNAHVQPLWWLMRLAHVRGEYVAYARVPGNIEISMWYPTGLTMRPWVLGADRDSRCMLPAKLFNGTTAGPEYQPVEYFAIGSSFLGRAQSGFVPCSPHATFRAFKCARECGCGVSTAGGLFSLLVGIAMNVPLRVLPERADQMSNMLHLCSAVGRRASASGTSFSFSEVSSLRNKILMQLQGVDYDEIITI